MIVTFKSRYACSRELFDELFSRENNKHGYISSSPTPDAMGKLCSYRFATDVIVRDVRSWGSDALGCGLVTRFSVEVE